MGLPVVGDDMQTYLRESVTAQIHVKSGMEGAGKVHLRRTPTRQWYFGSGSTLGGFRMPTRKQKDQRASNRTQILIHSLPVSLTYIDPLVHALHASMHACRHAKIHALLSRCNPSHGESSSGPGRSTHEKRHYAAIRHCTQDCPITARNDSTGAAF